jgi:lipoprotein-releasing system ATP-binding protein
MIVAKNIHKFYENKHILKGIDIKIEEGEIVSLIGSSGAGKTTLLQILSTIEKYEAGYDSMLSLNGINLDALNKNEIAKLRNENLGFVFQFHELLPEFTVVENICIPAFIKGISKIDAQTKADKLIEYFGISNIANNKPSEISGGEKQRVAVARALINSPKIIFADEPSGNLDSQNSQNLYEYFLKLRKDFNYTFLIATHDQKLAKKSDRVIEINDGQIIS